MATPSLEVCDNCLDDDGDGAVDRGDPQCPLPVNGGGTGIGDAVRGKALLACTKAIRKAGIKVTGVRLTQIRKCLGAITTCVQQKPNDDACLPKARLTCDKAVAAIAAAETTVAATMAKSCAPAQTATDLFLPSGLGYGAEAGICALHGVGSLSTIGDVESCLTRQHACASERLVGAQVPRAAELLGLIGYDAAQTFPCLDSTADAAGAGLDPVEGALVAKCGRSIAQAGASFVKGRINIVRRCANAVLSCLEVKGGDPGCLAKAEATCQSGALKLPALATKLSASITKKCGTPTLDPTMLLAPEGLGYEALADSCAARGVASLDSVDALITCLRLEHQCRADQLLENEMPRLHELLSLGATSLQ